jgi:hypothetical protein
MFIVIMAAGKSSRWRQDTPKQLAEVDKEPILYRTIRLLKLRHYGCRNFQSDTCKGCTHYVGGRCTHLSHGHQFVTVRHPLQFGPLNTNVIVYNEKNGNKLEIDRFYKFDSYNGTVVYLYGDVYYTERAIDKILNEDGTFFGRHGRSPYSGKQWPEIFAVKGNHNEIQGRVDEVRQLFLSGQISRCIGWELYKQCYGLKKINVKHIVPINDETDDFDSKNEYTAWVRKRNEKSKGNPNRA